MQCAGRLRRVELALAGSTFSAAVRHWSTRCLVNRSSRERQFRILQNDEYVGRHARALNQRLPNVNDKFLLSYVQLTTMLSVDGTNHTIGCSMSLELRVDRNPASRTTTHTNMFRPSFEDRNMQCMPPRSLSSRGSRKPVQTPEDQGACSIVRYAQPRL